MSLRLLLVLGLIASSPACGDSRRVSPVAQTTGEGGRLSVQVGALGSAGEGFRSIAAATYDLVIAYFDGERGWVELVRLEGYASRDPNGAMTYVAPCEAYADGADRPGQVTVTLRSLRDADGAEILDAQLPISQTQQFMCKENRDVRAAFELTVLRSAHSGFTDITVDLDQIYCAAKFDCSEALMKDAAGEQQPTLVTGLTCRGAGPDTSLTFKSDLVCFDLDGVPIAATPTTEVFTGFETSSAQAFHNTATRFDGAFMAPYQHCSYRAWGWITSRDGGDRSAMFRTGTGHIAWELELRREPSTGELVCEGTVAPDYTEVRADQAASPRDGRVRPTREAPLMQDIFLLDGALRNEPDCRSEESLAGESRLALMAEEAARQAVEVEKARLEAALEDRRSALTSATAAGEGLDTARAAGEQDANGAALYEALNVALAALNALDRQTDAVGWAAETAVKTAIERIIELIWGLFGDAEADTFKAEHFTTALSASTDLGVALAGLVAGLEAAIGEQASQLEAIDSGHIASREQHGVLVAAMNACRVTQREVKSIRFTHLASRFPWEEHAFFDPVVDEGYVSVPAGEEIELLSACAIGNPEHIERIATQVRVSSGAGVESARGYLQWVRQEPPATGFACLGLDGSCTIYPLGEIPCALDNRVSFDVRGGYTLGDGL